MSAALMERDVRADELHDMLDCGAATLRGLADRLQASADDMALIYRETEIDEIWRWVDVGLMQAEYRRAPAAEIAHRRALKAEVMRIHDLVGIDLDTGAAVASLRALAQALDAAA